METTQAKQQGPRTRITYAVMVKQTEAAPTQAAPVPVRPQAPVMGDMQTQQMQGQPVQQSSAPSPVMPIVNL
jgi:hypothetical protein